MMKTSRESKNTISPLHTYQPLPLTTLNRAFAVVYTCAALALFYHHILTLIHSTTLLSIFLRLSLLVSDAIFTFMWATTQAFRMRPIKRKEYLENLPCIIDYKDYPSLDVFICTADPYKEPPINVINTALSVMAYDYPSDKVSVYVSDDGGSMLTLFAFMEAAKFATHWLPFCRENNIVDRCPAAYFQSTHAHIRSSKTEEIRVVGSRVRLKALEQYRWEQKITLRKPIMDTYSATNRLMMYESMKMKVESVVDRGSIEDEFITGEKDSEAFKKWTTEFTRNDHPTIIQVLLESAKVKDITGHRMPNLVYISREKNKTSPHHFKAGALNVLIRVSATMTNAPMVLTQDCDMYSNDPQTPLRALCYILDPTKASSDLAYIQFPQRFHGINKNDIYASELKRLFQINPRGMDGLAGPNYVGSGCFFLRRALFGGPLSALSPEIPELNPNHVVDKSIQSEAVMALAHNVASCKFEDQTNWGSKMGFRYGSLVEDYFSGYRLLCEGWKSVFCDPDRPAFLGDVPITLNDSLSQTRRWCVGLLEVTFSKYCPITFGVRSKGLFMGLAFAHYAFWPIYSVPITIYGILPPLALINGVSMFPKVSSPWFYVHMFLFLGAYGQDFLDYIIGGGTFRQWYNDQRMWMIRSVSSHLFGFIDYVLKSLGISAFGFNVTSKVVDDEESKRYEQGLFEFGVASSLFVPITAIALINLVAFIVGLSEIFTHGNWENVFVQLIMSGFVAVNCWPIYEAIILRVDRGRMHKMVIFQSVILVMAMYSVAYFTLKSQKV